MANRVDVIYVNETKRFHNKNIFNAVNRMNRNIESEFNLPYKSSIKARKLS